MPHDFPRGRSPPVSRPSPSTQVLSGSKSQFAAGQLTSKFQKMAVAAPVKAAKVNTTVESIQGKSGRKCMLTGKKANNGWSVSFSHIRNKKLQGVNLQYKRVYWPEKQRYVRLRISTSAMKSINKIGLEAMAKRAGLDLESLAYSDASAERREWLVENGAEPQRKNKRAPKGPKPVYIPKWKEAQMKRKGMNVEAETKRFAERWGMTVA
mmetsp:Transcript_4057/g.15063  ORF Transcript_4057/g.15063 Transcript_4057/m.15063 type:complete len:209 (-) Transcript_4057:153-779(-)